jgi:hypothetical protein
MIEKGVREVTDVYVKSFMKIIKKICEEVEKSEGI